MAKRAFTQKRQLLTNKKLNINMRKNFAKCYVWSVLLYGCETWTINGQDKMNLEVMEIWIWRSLLKISWTERKSKRKNNSIENHKRKKWKNVRSPT